jgi:hypothetical protein
MRRRRLVTVAAVAALAAGLAWWLWPDRLSTVEQPFVGVWRLRGANQDLTFTLAADHRMHMPAGAIGPTETTGGWWVRNGKAYFDYEPSPLRRAFRPLCTRLGMPLGPVLDSDPAAFDLDGRTEQAVFARVKSD